MARGKRKKGLRKHIRAVQRGREKRRRMRRLLGLYALTSDMSLLSQIKTTKGGRKNNG